MLGRMKKNVKFTMRLIQGYRQYLKTESNTSRAYAAMINLHCNTGGLSTRLLARDAARRSPFHVDDSFESIFGSFSASDVKRIAADIDEHGYTVLEQRVPEDICDAIVEFATTHPARVESSDEHDGEHLVYDSSDPQGRIYKMEQDASIENPAVQKIVADPLFRSTAGVYLGATPILTDLNLWWSTLYQRGDTSMAAQEYHFDMSRPKWLNCFIYLTDVGPNSGPHCFVEGSHKANSPASRKVLSKGYRRVPDSEIHESYGADAVQELVGTKGTALIVDTVGFHKGKIPIDNHRLILQTTYSCSLFGSMPLPRVNRPAAMIDELEQAYSRHAETYRVFNN